MLTAEPGSTPAHGLDVRSKLLFQVGFAVAAFATATPVGLAGLAGVAALALWLSGLSPLRVVRAYWFVFAVLALGPLGAVLTLGPPWVGPGAAVDPAMRVTQVALVLFVSGAYVRTTPVRETRAALQRHLPGRAGRLVGVGVALTFRFVPVLRGDLRTAMGAMRARLGDERSVVDRGRRLGVTGLSRAFTRADRLSLALRARCFAWNPTLPVLCFRRRDYLVAAAGVGLACSGFVRLAAGRLIPVAQ